MRSDFDKNYFLGPFGGKKWLKMAKMAENGWKMKIEIRSSKFPPRLICGWGIRIWGQILTKIIFWPHLLHFGAENEKNGWKWLKNENWAKNLLHVVKKVVQAEGFWKWLCPRSCWNLIFLNFDFFNFDFFNFDFYPLGPLVPLSVRRRPRRRRTEKWKLR